VANGVNGTIQWRETFNSWIITTSDGRNKIKSKFIEINNPENEHSKKSRIQNAILLNKVDK
jgi:hypothetical protein